MTAAPRVYSAIASVMSDLAKSGIPKTQASENEGYCYRSIDEVCERLSPLLARQRLCILPRVLDRQSSEIPTLGSGRLVSVSVKVAYEIVSARDGSTHTIVIVGEAIDSGDKATTKAMSSAYKQAMLQLFCVPVAGTEGSPGKVVKGLAKLDEPDPINGWDQWLADMSEMIRVCDSIEAIERVQLTYRAPIRSSSKRRPDIFEAIGKTLAERRTAIAGQANSSDVYSNEKINGGPLNASAATGAN
jgi:hypothetical protein